jgi:replication-associated recombination protein RarA
MYDPELIDVPYAVQSLDDRRPRYRRQIIGNPNVHLVLGQSMKNGALPQLILFSGASGTGKTTWSQAIARHHFCKGDKRREGDACGKCEMCCKGLGSIYSYHERTGADLENGWQWWLEYGPDILSRAEYLLFLDEAQDLSELRQKMFLRQLERARARVVFATTHRHAINDALANRFFPHIFELGRPSIEEATDFIVKLCEVEQLQSARDLLWRVVQHYGCDMRKCCNFVFAAVQQTQDKLLTESYVNALLGSVTNDQPISVRRALPKL